MNNPTVTVTALVDGKMMRITALTEAAEMIQDLSPEDLDLLSTPAEFEEVTEILFSELSLMEITEGLPISEFETHVHGHYEAKVKPHRGGWNTYHVAYAMESLAAFNESVVKAFVGKVSERGDIPSPWSMKDLREAFADGELPLPPELDSAPLESYAIADSNERLDFVRSWTIYNDETEADKAYQLALAEGVDDYISRDGDQGRRLSCEAVVVFKHGHQSWDVKIADVFEAGASPEDIVEAFSGSPWLSTRLVQELTEAANKATSVLTA